MGLKDKQSAFQVSVGFYTIDLVVSWTESQGKALIEVAISHAEHSQHGKARISKSEFGGDDVAFVTTDTLEAQQPEGLPYEMKVVQLSSLIPKSLWDAGFKVGGQSFSADEVSFEFVSDEDGHLRVYPVPSLSLPETAVAGQLLSFEASLPTPKSSSKPSGFSI